jgi:hypothetical protein
MEQTDINTGANFVYKPKEKASTYNLATTDGACKDLLAYATYQRENNGLNVIAIGYNKTGIIHQAVSFTKALKLVTSSYTTARPYNLIMDVVLLNGKEYNGVSDIVNNELRGLVFVAEGGAFGRYVNEKLLSPDATFTTFGSTSIPVLKDYIKGASNMFPITLQYEFRNNQGRGVTFTYVVGNNGPYIANILASVMKTQKKSLGVNVKNVHEIVEALRKKGHASVEVIDLPSGDFSKQGKIIFENIPKAKVDRRAYTFPSLESYSQKVNNSFKFIVRIAEATREQFYESVHLVNIGNLAFSKSSGTAIDRVNNVSLINLHSKTVLPRNKDAKPMLNQEASASSGTLILQKTFFSVLEGFNEQQIRDYAKRQDVWLFTRTSVNGTKDFLVNYENALVGFFGRSRQEALNLIRNAWNVHESHYGDLTEGVKQNAKNYFDNYDGIDANIKSAASSGYTSSNDTSNLSMNEQPKVVMNQFTPVPGSYSGAPVQSFQSNAPQDFGNNNNSQQLNNNNSQQLNNNNSQQLNNNNFGQGNNNNNFGQLNNNNFGQGGQPSNGPVAFDSVVGV